MKYSEQRFKFPIRIYDRFLAQKAQKQEENMDVPMEGEWRQGVVSVPYEEIALWSDFFDSEQGPEGVDKEGFHFTIVDTWNIGSFISTWDRVTFTKELDKFAEKYEAWKEQEIKGLLEKLEGLSENQNKQGGSEPQPSGVNGTVYVREPVCQYRV